MKQKQSKSEQARIKQKPQRKRTSKRVYTHESLTKKYRKREEEFSDEFKDRMRRAISWIQRAEQEEDQGDPYAAVIFYWIAFNAAYGIHTPNSEGESTREEFRRFFRKIVERDEAGEQGRVYSVIWDKYSGPIRGLLKNHFVFGPFWMYQNGDQNHHDWETKFRQSQKRALVSLARKSTVSVLSLIFDRLYVLRNQLMHGEATWRNVKTDTIKRPQVQDGASILSALIPIFIDIMMDHPKARVWGKLQYRVIRN